MTTKNCANGPKLVLKDLCEKSFVRNVLYSSLAESSIFQGKPQKVSFFTLSPHVVLLILLVLALCIMLLTSSPS